MTTSMRRPGATGRRARPVKRHRGVRTAGQRQAPRGIKPGTPEWDAAVKAALADAIAAGRIPERPPARLLARVADLLILKEREAALLQRRGGRKQDQ